MGVDTGPEAKVSRPSRHPAGDPRQLAGVVERNVRDLLEQRREQERRRGLQERVADAVTRFAGSMRFVYLHLVLFGL